MTPKRVTPKRVTRPEPPASPAASDACADPTTATSARTPLTCARHESMCQVPASYTSRRSAPRTARRDLGWEAVEHPHEVAAVADAHDDDHPLHLELEGGGGGRQVCILVLVRRRGLVGVRPDPQRGGERGGDARRAVVGETSRASGSGGPATASSSAPPAIHPVVSVTGPTGASPRVSSLCASVMPLSIAPCRVRRGDTAPCGPRRRRLRSPGPIGRPRRFPGAPVPPRAVGCHRRCCRERGGRNSNSYVQ